MLLRTFKHLKNEKFKILKKLTILKMFLKGHILGKTCRNGPKLSGWVPVVYFFCFRGENHHIWGENTCLKGAPTEIFYRFCDIICFRGLRCLVCCLTADGLLNQLDGSRKGKRATIGVLSALEFYEMGHRLGS